MSDLIDRQKAIRNICNEDCHQPIPCKWKCIAIEELEDLPSVQPRKGKWILDNPHSEIYRYACSECHAHHRGRYDFCPSCGADMREGDSDE